MSEIADYIAISAAKGRLDRLQVMMRPKLLQQAQLEGGRLIDDADGVVSELVPCPACKGEGVAEVMAPLCLEAAEMALPHQVAWTEIADDVLLWGIKAGVLKFAGVNAEVFDAFARTADATIAEMMARLGAALIPRRADVLRVVPPGRVMKGTSG